MRKQIAAANWKMNLSWQEGEKLIDDLLSFNLELSSGQQVILAVPMPYVGLAKNKLKGIENIEIAAQNCYHQKNGAYTGETSVSMLKSLGVQYVIIGHSERRQYFNETNEILARKIDLCLEENITPIFCCGEQLNIREANQQDLFVSQQLKDALFHLDENAIQKVIIAYEPVWAIGTGKTATDQQAQEMHKVLRDVLKEKYGAQVANNISILYGGSVKANNAQNLFIQADVDGGLVGGASLNAEEFSIIIKSLQEIE